MHPIAIGNAIAVAATLLAIAGVLIALITSSQRKNQARLEFLRSAMERGVELNPELIDKVMHPNRIAAGRQAFPRGYGARVAGILIIAFGVGYAILAFFIAIGSPDARLPMLGVACLFACIGVGLLVVSRVLRSEHGVTDPRQ
jgi:hypothetical protein